MGGCEWAPGELVHRSSVITSIHGQGLMCPEELSSPLSLSLVIYSQQNYSLQDRNYLIPQIIRHQSLVPFSNSILIH